MRKKITAAGLLLILISLFALGSAAYFTTDGKATNIVTTDGLSMSLKEEFGPDDTWIQTDNIFTLDRAILPGQMVEKKVNVVNDGKKEAFYTRVKVDIEIRDKNGEPMSDDYDQYIDMDFNTTDWLLRDGWWHCLDPVRAGSETKLLFTRVLLAPGTPNEMQEAKVSVIVTAQAVQTKNNPVPEGGSTADVKGWPAA